MMYKLEQRRLGPKRGSASVEPRRSERPSQVNSATGRSELRKQETARLAMSKRAHESEVRNLSTLKRLKIDLHHKQSMPTEVNKHVFERALDEIERDDRGATIPLQHRGGEVLESVNDVFNLMAMKIQIHAKCRKDTAEQFKNETRKYKTKPNVIYIKGPRDRLLMMTE